ncbi:hypothetical protein FKP32DRAFT_1597022 [Trametes sanguinea]|nr:hypothetical protein FKP32DRAFT_1597022 [Trametes sanguinea]
MKGTIFRRRRPGHPQRWTMPVSGIPSSFHGSLPSCRCKECECARGLHANETSDAAQICPQMVAIQSTATPPACALQQAAPPSPPHRVRPRSTGTGGLYVYTPRLPSVPSSPPPLPGLEDIRAD